MARYIFNQISRKHHIRIKSNLKSGIRLLAVLIFVFSMASLGAAMAGDKPPETDDLTIFNQGTMAPDFSLESLNGGRITLSELRGKLVLIDFWATW